MGLLIDTDVLVLAERGKVGLDLGRYLDYGNAFISVLTASELLVGCIGLWTRMFVRVAWLLSRGCCPLCPSWPSTLKPLGLCADGGAGVAP